MNIKLMFHYIAVSAIVGLAGCGESTEEAYIRGYDEGYYDGQYEVCEEVGGIAEDVRDELGSCSGL